MREITITTKKPVMADELLQKFGVLMQGGGKGKDSQFVKDSKGNYKARCLGDLDYVQFAIKEQGYSFIKIN